MSDGFQEVKPKSNYIKFNKVNDYIQGTLTKVMVPTQPDQFNRMDKKYTILCEKGQIYGGTMDASTGNYVVDTNPTTLDAGQEYIVTGKTGLDSSMSQVQIGQKVIIQLSEFRQSKKGNRPAKIMKVLAGGMDQDWLDAQANEALSLEDVANAGQ